MIHDATDPEAGEIEALQRLKREAQDALESIRAGFLLRRPFLAMIAMRLDLVAVIDDRLRTAATNGSVIYFDARFFFECSEEKRLFVFAHEVWHCALGHMSRAAGRLPNLWNIAVDHEVNCLLQEDGFPRPDDAVYFEKYDGVNAERVYDHLVNSGADLPSGFDLHLPLTGLPEEGGAGSGDNTVLIDTDFRPFDAPPSEAQATRMRLEAAREATKRHGTLPGLVAFELDQLERARTDWRPILSRFVKNAMMTRLNWSRPQRRHVHAGLYLPSRRRDKMRIAIAVDVSGSVFDIAPAFIAEAMGILSQSSVTGIDLMLFDIAIRTRANLTSPDDLPAILKNCQGGGGTDFRPLFVDGLLDETVAALIVLTDGFGPAPDTAPKTPTLWALTTDGEKPAPWGEMIRLPDLTPSPERRLPRLSMRHPPRSPR
ncbi:VWA-like domain-containing protein [Roseibaca sp. V10]|uniref:VWA-like domain-containing protein n=1 Tax=Roseinatronobacter domitianus TaxID=2940293 RepID=A0ABT0M3P9_9RHOB|nr:VWA-like domain-containing protein [Roseibaca domitiana]MCL1629496.1 VWA-like domain-containing protein [Roseibaca domitiana]